MNCGCAPEVKCSIHGHCTYFLYYIIIITIIVTESVGCPSDFRWLCPPKNVRIGMFGGVCGEMFGGMFGGYIVFSVISSSSSFDFPEHARVFPVVCNSQLVLNRSLLESEKEAQRPGAS